MEKAISSGKYPFVMCNFAPPDMVGHTGVYEATVKAVTATGISNVIHYDKHKNNFQRINVVFQPPHNAISKTWRVYFVFRSTE